MSNDNKNSDRDWIWNAAWSWVTRQHEKNSFDSRTQAEFAQWLAADPAHRQAYEQASDLWLIAGLVPPANDIVHPDCEEHEDE